MGEGKVCFVISPIGNKNSAVRRNANKALRQIISPALKEVGYKGKRIDREPVAGPITEAIIKRLSNSPLCIADLTGLNPNCLYEVGIRRAWALPLVSIAEEGTDLPFDIKDHNTVFYSLSNTEEAVRSLSGVLRGLKRHLALAKADDAALAGNALAKGMCECSRRFTLDILFDAKVSSIQGLTKYLRKLTGDMEQEVRYKTVTESGAKSYSASVGELFGDLGTEVVVIENILGSCGHPVPNKDGCVGFLKKMKKLQDRGASVVRRLHRRGGKIEEFKQALAEIEKLISVAEKLGK